jgi:hypothetical protein
MLSRRRENPGFVSSALRAASAVVVDGQPVCHGKTKHTMACLLTLLVLAGVEGGLQQLGNCLQL